MFSGILDDEMMNAILEIVVNIGSLIGILIALVVFFASLSCCLFSCLICQCCGCCPCGRKKQTIIVKNKDD